MTGKYNYDHCAKARWKKTCKKCLYKFLQVEMKTDNLPGNLEPRTLASRHICSRVLLVIWQENLIVIILPFKRGTDFFHYREKMKAFLL